MLSILGCRDIVGTASTPAVDGCRDKEGASVESEGDVGASEKVGTSILLSSDEGAAEGLDETVGISSPPSNVDGDRDGFCDSLSGKGSEPSDGEVEDSPSTNDGLAETPASITMVEGLNDTDGLVDGVIDVAFDVL